MKSEFLSSIFSLVTFASMALFFVGLFSPQKALFWFKGERSKKKSSLIHLASFIVGVMLTQITKPIDIKSQEKSNAPATTATEPNPEVSKPILNLTPGELILSEKELDNAKFDKKWSSTTSNGLSNSYRKKLDNFRERSIKLELYQFDDSTAANNKFQEDMDSYFNRTRDDGNGGREKNPFYSQKISVEKIGDKSFCYKFVSPTIEVLYKNYIISCDVTIDYTYENISESNAATLKKAKSIIKQQIEKIKTKNQY